MKGRSKKYMRFAITGAAVAPPECPTTCIYDANDPLVAQGGGPSSGATYTKATTGNTIIPLAVDGYGINIGPV